MKQIIAFVLAMLPFWAHAQYRSQVWSPDNGDGTFTNPVINADYSDPDVIAVGEDYWLTASSFANMPGLPILHSRDLVNWEIVNHAIRSQFPNQIRPEHGNGVWAPSIRFHNNTYYIYWGDPDRGVMMTKATDPRGEWSKPVRVVRGLGMIDACPLWDDDGRCYLVNGWANSRAGFNSMLSVRELSADGTRAISDPVIVFDGGNENFTTEGPKFYKRDGWYWIMCPAGGVPTGWQLAMRSKSPYGPYEAKRVLQQGKTKVNGPHQGGWVHTAFGEDWFLHFQDKGAYGRVVWLEPVDWSSGWPIMGRKGEPVITYKKPKSNSKLIVNPVESDEFNTVELGKQWQWQTDYKQTFGMPTNGGFFRLFTFRLTQVVTKKPEPNLFNVPNMLLQKTPADRFTATAKVRFAAKVDGQQGGIIIQGLDYSALVIQRTGDNFTLRQLVCTNADKGKEEKAVDVKTMKPTAVDPIPYHPSRYLDLYLQVVVKDGVATFAYSENGKKFTTVGEPFKMREGKWIGAKVGMIATTPGAKDDFGMLDIDWFRVTK